jgi:hypothetical protein
MNRKTMLVPLLVVLCFSAPALTAAARGQEKPTLGGDIVVAAGATQEKVFSFGGNIVIEGRVRQDVVAIGGSITVSGEVGKSVVGIGSRVRIKQSAVIGEDVAALGGTLEKEPGCSVRGDTIYFQTAEIGDRLFKKGPLFGLFALKFTPFFLFLKLAVVLVWAFLAVLGLVLLPKQVVTASESIRTSFGPVFLTGLVAVLVFTGLIIFSTLLSIVLIGIPILIAVATAGIIIKIFGQLAVFHFFGSSFLRGLKAGDASPLAAALVGLLVVSLLGFVPVLGLLFSLVVAMMAWGTAVRTRFGTTENWFRPQAKNAQGGTAGS